MTQELSRRMKNPRNKVSYEPRERARPAYLQLRTFVRIDVYHIHALEQNILAYGNNPHHKGIYLGTLDNTLLTSQY